MHSRSGGKRKAVSTAPCAHPASISVKPHAPRGRAAAVLPERVTDSDDDDQKQHFCVMCGTRLPQPVRDVPTVAADATANTSSSDSSSAAAGPAALAPERVHRPLTGREVGISEYTTDRSLWARGGVIKARCTDFVVEEVRWDGSVVSTRAQSVDPAQGFGYWHRGERSPAMGGREVGAPQLSERDHGGGGGGGAGGGRSPRDATRLVRRHNSTASRAGVAQGGRPSVDGDDDAASCDTADNRENTRVVLVKANCSTFEAIRMLSQAAGLPIGRITMAGLKVSSHFSLLPLVVARLSVVACSGMVAASPHAASEELSPGRCRPHTLLPTSRTSPAIATSRFCDCGFFSPLFAQLPSLVLRLLWEGHQSRDGTGADRGGGHRRRPCWLHGWQPARAPGGFS